MQTGDTVTYFPDTNRAATPHVGTIKAVTDKTVVVTRTHQFGDPVTIPFNWIIAVNFKSVTPDIDWNKEENANEGNWQQLQTDDGSYWWNIKTRFVRWATPPPCIPTTTPDTSTFPWCPTRGTDPRGQPNGEQITDSGHNGAPGSLGGADQGHNVGVGGNSTATMPSSSPMHVTNATAEGEQISGSDPQHSEASAPVVGLLGFALPNGTPVRSSDNHPG